VTFGHQCCCVALAAFENMLIRLCMGISVYGFATGDLTANLANKDCEVPFDILLARSDKRQGSRVPGETLSSLFSELAVRIRQYFLCLSNSHTKPY